jgi:hypothetical protein
MTKPAGVQVQGMVDQNLTVTAETVASAATSYLENNQLAHLLHAHGGRFKAGKSWCNELLSDMNLPRRKCTTQASKLPEDWESKGRRLELQVFQHFKWPAIPVLIC